MQAKRQVVIVLVRISAVGDFADIILVRLMGALVPGRVMTGAVKVGGMSSVRGKIRVVVGVMRL